MKAAMLDDATALTADTLRLVLGIILTCMAYGLGQWVYARTNRQLLGWAAGIALFLVVGFAIQPARDLLKAESCRNVSDYDLCVNGALSTE